MKAVEAGKVNPYDVNSMLCSAFYAGLCPHLKSISGYKFEKFNTFDELRVEVRRLEAEFPSKTTHAKAVTSVKDEQIEKLTGIVNQLRSEVSDFKQQFKKQDSESYSNRGRPYQRGSYRGKGRPFNSNNRYTQRDKQTNENTENEITCHRCGFQGHVKFGCRKRFDVNGKALN